MAEKLEDGSGIELALERPLFPVAALRSMNWIGGEDTSWASFDDDFPDCEPLLVTLWQGATEPVTDENDRDLYLSYTDSAAQAAALLAEAAFEFLSSGPIRDWWEAAGEDDPKITNAMAFGVRLATQATTIGRLAAGAAVQLISGSVDEAWPMPEVETEASWRTKAEAAGISIED
jgi:hypothetical protein